MESTAAADPTHRGDAVRRTNCAGTGSAGGPPSPTSSLLIALVAFVGVPTDRGSLLLIILAGLGIPCLGRGWRAFGKALLDWLPFTAVLVIYDVSRGIADGVGMPLHVSDIAAVDRGVFGTVPTVWLQQRFLDPGSPHWYDAVATLVYTTHFLATPVVAAVLWLRSRDAWKAFITRVIVLSVAGTAHLRPVPGGAAVVRRPRRGHRTGHSRVRARLAVAARQPRGESAQRGPARVEPGRGDAVAAHGIRHAHRVIRGVSAAYAVGAMRSCSTRRHGPGAGLSRRALRDRSCGAGVVLCAGGALRCRGVGAAASTARAMLTGLGQCLRGYRQDCCAVFLARLLALVGRRWQS